MKNDEALGLGLGFGLGTLVVSAAVAALSYAMGDA